MNWPFVKITRTYILLGIFGIAMAALEAIVVVYVRQLYYPQGFDFPLTLVPQEILFIEWLREAATIIMLAAIGMLAGKDSLQRALYFLFAFGIWDIFYYAWLKVFIGWPASFFTWDLLFLIPVPWIGPVLAPMICSLTMILLAASIIALQTKGYTITIKVYEWGLAFLGAFIILYTFIKDYSALILKESGVAGISSLAQNEHLRQALAQYKPTHYNWYLFWFGEIIILTALIMVLRRANSNS